MGDQATVAKQISIGVGALSGSTILLITIPWALSIFAGRVSLNDKGEGLYSRPLDVKADARTFVLVISIRNSTSYRTKIRNLFLVRVLIWIRS